MLMVFEATRTLETVPTHIETPMAGYEGKALTRQIIIAPILRAGLGLADGVHHLLPEASTGHIGICRNEETALPESMEHPGESYLGGGADDLLKRLYPLYDAIIFDSSPVLVADDTTSLAPKIDGTIFVVRFSFSSARRSREALDLLRKRQVNLIGVVCNGVDQLMKDYYYNKYPEYYAVKHDV